MMTKNLWNSISKLDDSFIFKLCAMLDPMIESKVDNLTDKVDLLIYQVAEIDDRVSWMELVLGQDVELDLEEEWEEEEYISLLAKVPVLDEEQELLLNDLSSSVFNSFFTLFAVWFIVIFSFNLLFKRLVR